METTFEKLNDQEMINVIGGDRVARVSDQYGNVFYIIVEESPKEEPKKP